MSEAERFISVFEAAKRRFEDDATRLAAEGWEKGWQVLISTIMSAQSRDPVTIDIAEDLFAEYPTLQSLAEANYEDVLNVFSSLNYNKSKARYVIRSAQQLLEEFDGEVPDTIDELLTLHGVGRKTANLVITEVHDKPGICVDTHVHRISNVLGFVDTDRADDTEMALKDFVPKEYWKEINRYFVLWGQTVPGHDAERLLDEINYKS